MKFDKILIMKTLIWRNRGLKMCTIKLLDRMKCRLCEGGVGTAPQDVSQHLYFVVAGGHTATFGVLAFG